MPKWISVEEAAAKYGINKEVIWLWADMKRFPMSYEKGITTVDEESLIGFLHQNKDRVTAEYIDTLEDLCICRFHHYSKRFNHSTYIMISTHSGLPVNNLQCII